MPVSPINEFINTVKTFYSEQYRPMPWRDNTSPYYVFVSEIMLQQTQVNRVIEKFNEFIQFFPDFESLAKADQNELLGAWNGLGYNRRALYLKKAAQAIMDKHSGTLPDTHEQLVTLNGIGPATASAILVYAYNIPRVYIETNIRSAFLHHFFKDASAVHDDEILPFVRECLDQSNPREWYWALMDYGTYIKKNVGNLNKKSKSYVKQSKFEGSRRQKRGIILRVLLHHSSLTMNMLQDKTGIESDELESILLDMVNEGFVKSDKALYSIPS